MEALGALGPLGGASSLAPLEAPSLTTNERRVMCVLLAGAPIAPDPSKKVLREQVVRSAVARHGGRLEPLANGALLVTFDGGGAAADEAARAARAALAMRAVLDDAPIVLVAGRAQLQGHVPMGEAIDRGAELLERASPGGPPLLNRVVFGFLEGRFEVRTVDDALELVAEHDVAGATRTLLGKSTTCVGRERDLASLQGIFDECIERAGLARGPRDRAPRRFGKSRVRYEFLRKLHASGVDVDVWTARGDPMSAGSPVPSHRRRV